MTRNLSYGEAKRLLDAYHRAEALGAPLNVAVDVHWAAAYRGADEHEAWAQWRDTIRRWFAYRDVPWHCVFVHESTASEFLHTHALVHVPPQLLPAFEAKAIATVGAGAMDNAVKVTPCRPPLGAMGKVHYMLKGLSKVDAEALGLPLKRKKATGGYTRMGTACPVTGKRSGNSKPLGPTAFEAQGGNPHPLPLH